MHYRAGGCTTQSIVMRSKSGTVRMIDGYHRLTKLREYSSVDFDLSDEQLARRRARGPAACPEPVRDVPAAHRLSRDQIVSGSPSVRG